MGSLQESTPLKPFDYAFRPKALEDFPLYFFLAGCATARSLSSDSMEWVPLERKGSAEICHHRSFIREPICSKMFPHRPLVDAENKPIHRYGFYVRLRTMEAWRVPILYGKQPSPVDATAPASEKANYAMYLMMLFRPHRLMNVFSSLCV